METHYVNVPHTSTRTESLDFPNNDHHLPIILKKLKYLGSLNQFVVMLFAKVTHFKNRKPPKVDKINEDDKGL